jgi:magnesium-transporting ATPase (P-type)
MTEQIEIAADRTAWHALTVRAALDRLGSHRDGLDATEAAERLRRYGLNVLPKAPRRSAAVRFLAQFNNMLVYLLIGAAIITAAISHITDAAVILAVVVINAVVGFIQEGRAEAALEAIRTMLAPHASVLRDGHRLTLTASELVPGDVVLLEPGDRIPADIRLLHVKGLQIDEAVLTGESLPVAKHVEPVAEDAVIGDRADLAFFGTLVTRGHGSGVVVETGTRTEIGRIGTMIEGVGTVMTPLLRRVGAFGRGLAFVVLAASATMFAWGVLVNQWPVNEMFLAAVGLAVAAIPEELPAILTIALAFGVERMARRNAIVRRLPAVETLGSVTVICSDKTGTLTRNEMAVETVATVDKVYSVSGTGYGPDGSITVDDAAIDPAGDANLTELAQAVCLCSDARLRRDHGDWRVEGDPMEGALIAFAAKAGVDGERDCAALPRIDVIPFESETQLMATLHRAGEGGGEGGVIYVKGAPERLLALCDRQRDAVRDERIDMAAWHRRIEGMTAAGERVIAVATRAVPESLTDMEMVDLEEGLTMLGLIGLADPPRREAIQAVADCRAAGIRIKMITGDHPETARSIAGRFGLATTEVMTGRDFDVLDADALAERAADIDVFARTSPEHKLRLVEALQSRGEIVSMTGDGVNDAPALKRADVGVAMGIKGSEAAKEAAQIVLADDNFASIAKAVEQGRTVYENIRKSIAFMLPTNGGEAMIVIGAIAVGLPLPITPIQILWINMVTTVTLALALAFEPAEEATMKSPPRSPKESIIGPYLVWRIAYVSVLMTAVAFVLFLYGESARGLDHARGLVVNLIVALEAAYLVNSRFVRGSVLSFKGLFGSRPVLIAIGVVILMQLAFTYLPPFQATFATEPLSLFEWGLVITAAAGLFVIVEIEKIVTRALLRR